jgi:spermidine/putrescine transport system permease protein
MNQKILPQPKDEESRGGWLAAPTAFYLFIFFIVPLLFMLVMSILTRGENLDDYQFPLTLDNYTALFKNPSSNTDFTILVRSLQVALITTVLCFIIGYPLAFWISTRRSKWVQQLALFMVVLPFWTNFLVRTYAWQIILGRRGVLNEFLFWSGGELGIEFIKEPLEILGTQTAVQIGMVYGFLPFMVLPIYASVERFNFRLVEAGHDLGGNDWRVFWRIVFPLTLPGVVAGWILVFIPAIGAFVTPALLGGVDGYMIGNRITRLFKEEGGSWVLGSGMSIVIMLIVMLALYLYVRYADTDKVVGRERRGLLDRFFDLILGAFMFVFDLIGKAAGAVMGGNKAAVEASPTGEYVISQGKISRDLWLRRIGKFFLNLNPIFCYIFLWLPIILLIAYSFNDSKRAGGKWEGFTTDWYTSIFEGIQGTGSQFSTDQMLEAVIVTLKVSIPATIVATMMGTMVALALERGRFRGKRPLDGLLYLPVVIPEITMAVSLVIFFKFLFDFIEMFKDGRYYLGMLTVILAHIAFTISFITIVVRARLTDMNPRYEEAARDLGANEWRTFWRITYPLLLPAIIAGGLLGFTISLDDFVITFFVGGGTTTTLTIYVYGLVRRGVSPEINAVSTMMIVASTLLIAISLLLQGRNASKT